MSRTRRIGWKIADEDFQWAPPGVSRAEYIPGPEQKSTRRVRRRLNEEEFLFEE